MSEVISKFIHDTKQKEIGFYLVRINTAERNLAEQDENFI